MNSDIGYFGNIEHRTSNAERRAEFAQNKFPRRVKTAVQKNRTEQGLECVRQRGRALAPAAGFFAVAENQVRAQAESPGMLGQRAAVDQFGAALGQRSFIERGKFFVKLVSQDELQHGVAEKFQPLVVRHGHAAFVRDGRMRERQPQQSLVAERVSETGLKFGGGHL